MNLILNSEEEEFLRELLNEHQAALLREISRADHRDFKHELQQKEGLLESLLTKLKRPQMAAS
jgi:hypothetical protein